MSKVLALTAFFALPAIAEPLVPWYAPRQATVAMWSRDALTPHLQIQWEWAFIEAKRDSLVAMVAGEVGYAIGFARAGDFREYPMTFFYQHLVGAGLGYRMTRENGFHWGLQVVTGPVFYGARFEGLRTENYIVGTVEGRAQLGWRLGRGARLAVSLGLSEPFNPPVRSNAAPFVGGFAFGLAVNWY